MSGTIGSNILSHSGIIAETAAGLNWNDTIITGSTVTVEAGRGYWINTTSNACTITLPSSAEAGDQIVIVDYARNWGTNKITLDSNGLNFQGNPDTYTVEYTTDGQSVNIIYSDSTKGWIPLEDDVVADEPSPPPTQRAIYAYGTTGTRTNVSNLVASNGTIGSDVTGVGTSRNALAAATYGNDKAIFGYGHGNSAPLSMTNLVTNQGVVGSDVTGVGTTRHSHSAVGYGEDTAMFSFGAIPGGTDYDGKTNLVNNQGVVGSDISQVGTERGYLGSSRYGISGQAIFAFGNINGGNRTSISNLVNNLGVIQSDTAGVGVGRAYVSGATYGSDKAIFCFGQIQDGEAAINTRSLVNSSGVIASDATGAGTARYEGEAVNYGDDKAIYAYGSGYVNTINLISNTGVVAADSSGTGTARGYMGAAGYSLSA